MEEKQIPNRQTYFEMDTRAAIRLFLKHKKLVLALSAAAALVVLAVSLALPKSYRASITLEVGVIPDAAGAVQIIENYSFIKEKADKDAYNLAARQKLGIAPADYPRVRIQGFRDSPVIGFFAESPRPEDAKNVLNEIAAVIIADHNEIFEAAKDNATSTGSGQTLARPTRVVGPVSVSEGPVSPHVALNTVLAALFGFFLALFLLFLVEWWRQ